MKKETILLVVIALIVGLLVGVIFTKGGSRKGASTGGAPQGQPAPVVDQQQTALLEGLVARDPKNRNAWVQLGNSYFDSDQAVKAVEAYAKALELDPNDPNVLTDQGVMFRRLGWYDRAIENFRKAQQIDPSHVQSLFNLGVVYRYDLQDSAKAREAWTRYLQINPSGPGSDQIRAEMEKLGSAPRP